MIRVCVFGSWVWKCKNIKWAEGELDIFTFSHERDKFTNKYHKMNLNSAFIPCFLLFRKVKSTTWYITQYHGVCITFHGTRYIAKHGINVFMYICSLALFKLNSNVLTVLLRIYSWYSYIHHSKIRSKLIFQLYQHKLM